MENRFATIFLGSLAALLTAAALIAGVYKLAIQGPQKHADHLAAARRLFDARLDNLRRDTVTGLTLDRLEQQLKDEDEGSPCNVLTEDAFALCATYDDVDSQRRTAQNLKK